MTSVEKDIVYDLAEVNLTYDALGRQFKSFRR